MRARGTPEWQIQLYEGADHAAVLAADHQGVKVSELKAQAAKLALRKLVCSRVAHIENVLRTLDPPTVAADVTAAVKAEGDKRRFLAAQRAEEEIKLQDFMHGHQRVFIPKLKSRGVWRCLKCSIRSGHGGDDFWAKRACISNNSLARPP